VRRAGVFETGPQAGRPERGPTARAAPGPPRAPSRPRAAVPRPGPDPPPPPPAPRPGHAPRCNELIGQVLAAPYDASVVQLMDDISDVVSRPRRGGGG
jgi:hypothetical protein